MLNKFLLIANIIEKVVNYFVSLRAKKNNSVTISIKSYTENNSITDNYRDIITANNSTTTNTEICTNGADTINIKSQDYTISWDSHTKTMSIKKRFNRKFKK